MLPWAREGVGILKSEYYIQLVLEDIYDNDRRYIYNTVRYRARGEVSRS